MLILMNRCLDLQLLTHKYFFFPLLCYLGIVFIHQVCWSETGDLRHTMHDQNVCNCFSLSVWKSLEQWEAGLLVSYMFEDVH